MSIIGSRNYTLLIGAAILLNSGLAQAGYITGYEWDFKNNFSSVTTNVTDSEGNVAWRYRVGAAGVVPSTASGMGWWNTGGFWEGNASPQGGKIGSGWLGSVSPGGSSQCPILIWESNVTGQVDIDIALNSTSGNYWMTIFKNDTALASENPDTGGYSLHGYSYSLKNYNVVDGDVIAIRINPWGSNTVTTDFTVTLVPEPATLAVLGAGLMLMVGRRRRR